MCRKQAKADANAEGRSPKDSLGKGSWIHSRALEYQEQQNEYKAMVSKIPKDVQRFVLTEAKQRAADLTARKGTKQRAADLTTRKVTKQRAADLMERKDEKTKKQRRR